MTERLEVVRQQMAASRHDCPVRGCKATVPNDMLMCGPHWQLVPKTLQKEVWRAYKRGKGAGSLELLSAQEAAIAAAELAPARTRPARVPTSP